MAEENIPASEAAHLFEPAPQIMENVRYKNGSPLDDKKVMSQIGVCEARLKGGRLLVRKSGTEPVIRIMAEGDDEKLVRQVVRDVAALIREAAV